MRSAPFDYQAPESVAEVTGLLAARAGTAKLLAGGQTLVPQMNKRAVCPQLVIDVKRIPGLRKLDVNGAGSVRIGSLVSHDELMRDERVRLHWPVLAAASSYVSNPVVRRRGTIGGSVGWGDGRSEIAAALIACDASAVATSSAQGTRRVPVAELTGDGPGALRDDELITEISIGSQAPVRHTYGVAEFSARRWDPPFAGAVCWLAWDNEDPAPIGARVVAFGELVSAHRLDGVEAALTASAGPAELRQALHRDAELTSRKLAVTRDRDYLAAVLGETASRALELARDGRG